MKDLKKMNKVCKLAITLCLIITIITITKAKDVYQKEKTFITVSDISNEIIEWGIKRNDNHEQPELGANNKKLLEEYNGIAMGNAEDKYVYLTFDLGYEAGYTSKILDTLKEKNVQGTFFITAHYLNTASDLVKRMIDEGHIVGNHTVNHKSMPTLSDEEIKKELMTLNQTMYEKFNYEMKYMRPPKGEYSERTLNIAQSLGFKTVMWSFAYVDWNEDNQPSNEEALNKIRSNFHNGEIMLLHATSKTNSNIMSQIINKAREDGFEFKNLDDFK